MSIPYGFMCKTVTFLLITTVLVLYCYRYPYQYGVILKLIDTVQFCRNGGLFPISI